MITKTTQTEVAMIVIIMHSSVLRVLGIWMNQSFFRILTAHSTLHIDVDVDLIAKRRRRRQTTGVSVVLLLGFIRSTIGVEGTL